MQTDFDYTHINYFQKFELRNCFSENTMINVTKSVLPPLEQYLGYLEGIWERGHLTNNGPLVKELEAKLKAYLQTQHFFFLGNGTISLQIAIRALDLQGEVITTPFSFVATTSSIVWENCTPVFVDIDPITLNIDPKKIEAAITTRTRAILATHVYGNPCDVEAIDVIAKRHNLKVIYDAAHCFGVRYKGVSIFNYGDISTLSLHATKLFHTIEGGAIITNDNDIAHKASYMRDFGYNGQEKFWGLGINGKNSELHAAMGLCLLPRVDQYIQKRKEISELYDRLLLDKGIVTRPKIKEETDYNYSYYPVLFDSEEALLKTRTFLNENKVFPRRYFYPSLSELGYVKQQNVPISVDTSRRVLCLPLYPDMEMEDVIKVAEMVIASSK